MSKLAGKVAVVTGASKGIGAGIATALAAEGAAVVVNYASSKSGADAVVERITKAGGKAIAVKADVSKADDAQALIDAAVKEFGRLDVLVNNSGVYEFAPLEAITPEHFHRHFDINVLGLLLTTKAASKHLGEGASVINIGSIVSRLTMPETAVYTATKGAVDAITGVLSRELGPRGINVNAVAPGYFATPVNANMTADEDIAAWLKQRTCLGRWGRPEELGGPVVFLLSGAAGFVTGHTLVVDGGHVMHF